jgi:hypothetical protein
MKLRLAGTVNRLNVEHPTSNIQRPILMTLRFIDFKTSEPQNPPQIGGQVSKGSFARAAQAPRVAQSIFKSTE